MAEMSEVPITEKEVGAIRKEMDGLKVVGNDGMHPTMAKPLAEILVKPFTHLFVSPLDEG